MAKERRAFENYPEQLRTRQNNRETFIADDPLYEPEQADFLNGFIGDTSVLSEEDLDRKPLIQEETPARQKYQLSVGATFINPESQERETMASYSDMVNQIEANGGDVSDPNRVFATEFYAWTPPIDYDKHINFSRYQWVGEGTADVQGEYVTKEPSHSKTVIHEWDGTQLLARPVEIVNGLPAPGAEGTFVEDASNTPRYIYRSDGAAWNLISFQSVSDVPTNFTGLIAPVYFYVARTGPDYQRPLVWRYSNAAGRWIPQPVVVSVDVPDIPRDGMVWEDSRILSQRRLKVFSNGTFADLTYSPADGPSGVGTDGQYIFDTRDYSELTDEWSRNNWWRHYEDLSSADRAARTNDDPAVRPILEFWNGIESVAGDTKDFRNDSPSYVKYAINATTNEGFDTSEPTTIFEYQEGTGTDDPVLGFPLSFNDSGEFLFELTLETDTSAFIGYHYFKDTITGYLHGIWFKSEELTEQEQDANGLYEIPVGISSNADHEILTVASRSRMLRHMTGVMGEQDTFAGSVTGLNGYRWTERDPTVGATIIDAEKTHLRTLATLQSTALDMPNAIRRMAKEYNKVLFRFTNRLNQLWDNLTLTNGNGSLRPTISASEACDLVLTQQFVGRTTDDFPFFYSDMGTYLQSTYAAGIITTIDPNPTPILIPPSPQRVGASAVFTPESILEQDGSTSLRGHEGYVVPSFGDERDLVWLELQNRFFTATPERFREETATFSTRFDESRFFLEDYHGNYVPQTSIEPVDQVVPDYNAIVGPTDGLRVFSTIQGVFALFSANQWFLRQAVTDDIFLNLDDNEYYIYNGVTTALIQRWNRPFDFEYTRNEYRTIIRRDFERYILFVEEDFTENTAFDSSDPFTWNYRSAGVEGHYQGIYQRVYNSFRPHSRPWEVMGYSIEPEWWRTSYVPDSTASDGSPRYGSAHPMWADFASGVVDTPSGSVQRDQFIMAGPVPVDSVGELLDPIAAGVVDETSLDKQRIDDFWIYGDGGPVEEQFLESPFYPFSVSLAGYLMKNGQWMDTLWSVIYVGFGTGPTNPVFRSPHVVLQDTLTRPDIGTLPVHLERQEDGTIVQRLGVQSWISEFVVISGGDATNDFGRIVRNTSPALTWKTAGYINDERTIITTLSRQEIPFTDVHVLLHKSQPIEQVFCSGVLIVREDPIGYRVFGFDPFDPFFTVERPAIPVVGGQVILEQDFIVDYVDDDATNVTGGAIYPNQTLQRTFEVTEFKLPSQASAQDTATLAVLVNGQRFKRQHITVDQRLNTVTIEDVVALEPGDRIAVQVITAQTNPSTQARQFVVNGVNFPYFVTGTGEFERIEYGRYYETATEVINFMVGYGRFLEQQGWVFDDISEAGATRDWLLGAKRFARWVLETESLWNPNPRRAVDILDDNTFYYSPVQDQATFVAPFGQTISVETIMNGAYGILNHRSEPIPVDQTEVTRIDDKVEVRRVDRGNENTTMYGVRINIIEAEHVVVFSNTTRFNDIIYDPVSGLAQQTLVVDTYRTLNWQGRLEANGYIISGGEILPNFEKQAFDITRFYDRYRTIDDPLRREEARNLYGFVPANQSRGLGLTPSRSITRRTNSDSSQYMVPIGAADRSRFDYYRGMIHTKGTNRAIYAYTRGTTIGRDNFFINEDWAWKVGPGEFGDTRREIVQIRVDKNDFRDEVQVFQFAGPIDARDNTVEVENFERSDPDGNPRWLLPPAQCRTDDTCNLEFPISRDTGLIDVDGFRYYAKLFEGDTQITIQDHFHYDPELDRFDPTARCLLDFENPLDPAFYTDGPGADYSNGRCWRDEQVGYLWWRPNRKLFLDYRDLSPEYEDMAKVWGEPLYYKAFIERPGTLVQDQTEADYNGDAGNGTFDGGTGHAVSDVITLSDGSTVTVEAVSSGVVTEFTITTVGSTLVQLGFSIVQTSSTGAGTTFSLTPAANNTENNTDQTIITTYDYRDLERTTPVAHGVPIGEEVIITIRKADQDEYNLVNQTVTAISTTELEFDITTNPDTPATGDPECVFGHVDIYEWVESPVLPTEWEDYVAGLNDPTHPNGTPLNVDDPSYTTITITNPNNTQTTLYYFWVLNSSGNNGRGKSLTAAQISQRLEDPIASQRPWFAPVDENHMFVFTDGEKVEDGYAFEIIIDHRYLHTHYGFILLSEDSQFFDVPQQVVDKVVDSLAELDEKGNTVPSPLLNESEKYGSCFWPIQTIYADVDSAREVYLVSLNRLFARKDLEGVENLTGIFKIDDEYDATTNPTGYWQRSLYQTQAVEDQDVYDTVQTTAERDSRAAAGLYFTGDRVRVIESGNVDLWTGDEVFTDYVYDADNTTQPWAQVAIENHTVTLVSGIFDPPARFRGTPDDPNGLFFFIYELLTKAEQNSFIFSMLYEMLNQHPDPRCDWFFKTSYITTQVFTTTDKSPFVRPDEVTAIRDNILDVKAFRSKFRGETNTVTISEQEAFDTNILEFPDKKISLFFDRLSCNLLDDCGWDAPAWDSRALPCSTWDTPLWEFDELGQEEFYIIETIQGDGGTTQYVIDAIFDPTLYGIKIPVRQNGVVVSEDAVADGLFLVTNSHTQIFLDTQFALGVTFEFDVMQSQGFYQGDLPSFIGTTLEGSLAQPAPSDYEHAIARTPVPPTEFYTVVGGDGNTFTTTSGPYIEIYLNGVLQEQNVDYVQAFDYAGSQFSAIFTVAPVPGDVIAFVFMRGCLAINDDLGGRPEERVVTEVCDSVNICVINDHTDAYNGWDTTPWDTTGWDISPSNIGRRVFLMAIGKEETIPPGVEFFVTSEDVGVVDPYAIVGTSPQSYTVVQYELNKGSGWTVMTEGVEFESIGTVNTAIRTRRPDQQDFVADGITTSFVTTAGTEVEYVFLDGALQTEGVSYLLDATRTVINWIQPAPIIISNDANYNGRSQTADGFEDVFETGQLRNSLAPDNIFVFQNGVLVPSTDYVISTGGPATKDITLSFTPAEDDRIQTYTLGNTFADNSVATVIDTFTAAAAQTVFNTTSGGFVTDETTYAFVDGVYQILGTDYTVTGTDQITFVAPLAGGENVEVRTIQKGIVDSTHIVFSASGTASDVIPGFFEAEDVEEVIIFLDNVLQDGWTSTDSPDYTITDTNPDTINWTLRNEITELDWSGVDGPNLPTGVTPAAYFDLSSTTADYRFWFSDGSTTAPAAAGRTLVPIAFVGTESDQEIADLVQMELAGNREFTELDWTGVTGASLPNSAAIPAAYFDLSSTTTDYRFWFSDGMTLAPAPAGRTLVGIAFSAAASDLSIASGVETAIEGADILFSVNSAFTVLTVKVAENGVVTNAADGAVPTGVGITILRDGSGPTLDADFADALNGGGTSTVVVVPLVNTGEAADAADGSVPTNVAIDILQQGNDTPTIGQDITVRYTPRVQMSTTTIIEVLPQPGQTVSAQFLEYIEVGDTVRYRFNGWVVGPLGGYTVAPINPPLDTLGYDIVQGVMTFDSLPPENETFGITYTVDRPGGSPESILVRMPEIVQDILTDHQLYDPPLGFDEYRAVGTRVIDTTANLTYTWDGTIWNPDPVPVPGTQYYVTNPQQIWEWDGASWNLLFEVGGAFTKPPVLDFPVFGAGITYGTYAYGQTPDAATEYPDAYEVMQHPGDCPP